MSVSHMAPAVPPLFKLKTDVMRIVLWSAITIISHIVVTSMDSLLPGRCQDDLSSDAVTESVNVHAHRHAAMGLPCTLRYSVDQHS
jgi:hypothetical protein